MKILNTLLSLLVIIGVVSSSFGTTPNGGASLGNPYEAEFVIAQDTVPINERFGDFIHDPSSNPFDLRDPGIIEKEVEYDPTTGQYIITEKIGNDYFRMPTYMTFEEYLDYRAKEQEKAYFNQLSGVNTGDGNSGSGVTDPVDKYAADIKNSLVDRLFGGSGVEIRPQGKIELTFGVDFQRNANPTVPIRQQRTGGFDFDMNIQMNVTGKIGEKLNLSTSYNTQATFDFENRMKLQYDSEAFGEDDIIKNIDVGNISFPLKNSLIQGSENLFGIRIDSKWGRLSLSTVASQQNSRRESLSLQKGSQIQEFEVRADQYEENRHFFLSHYNRNTFTDNLSNLPQVKSLFKVNPAEIEVWITNTQNASAGASVREIIALADIGVAERENMTATNQGVQPPVVPVNRDVFGTLGLPDNDANPLHGRLAANDNARRLETSIATLTGPEFQLEQARDFEKITAVKMNPGDYTFNPELGILSINRIIQPDQVLAVAFQYDYNGKIYKVGEFANDIYDTTGTQVLFVKMLKSTTQRIDLPAWDLMMKNVYNIGAYQVDRNDFKLDIYYEDPRQGDLRFLPNTNLEGIPLLRVFNLDQLNVQGDPCPDGIFDFVNGITIQPRNGRIMFPVLEPFGDDLVADIEGIADKKQYNYFHLYDSTVTQAREHPEFNRFIIRGEYKSGGGGGQSNQGFGGNSVQGTGQEISLGAFNLPRGSVRVTAGGRRLVEGTDYRVDYSVGRVTILDPALANGTTPINVDYEDNTLFGFQTKTLLGVRADYEVNKNFNIGATWMHLFERPFTQKVNVGDDPINNTVYGLDVNYSKEAPWLTKAVDKLPFYNTKQPSTITFEAEAALLQPGHSKAINQDSDGDGNDERGGVVYVDDFEGTTSSIDLRTPANRWYLASVPQNDAQNNNPLFPESAFIDTTLTGVNRAKLSWYRMDLSIARDNTNAYEAAIPQDEVFPNAQIQPGFGNNIQTFDLTYYPDTRGPYNFDLPNGGTQYSAGLTDGARLLEPETRWGGIMRSLNTNDFQAANIEYIEFWMLDPFLDGEGSDGDLYFNLGNISEDILRDSRKFYENGLPTSTNDFETQTTSWSRVPINPTPPVDAFSNFNDDDRALQDVGLDGFDNDGERAQFSDILDIYRATLPGPVYTAIEEDPSGDDFVFFRDERFNTDPAPPVIDRYRDFNNPQGNSKSPDGNRVESGTNFPDNEDIDDDNTMNETEAYFQYKIPLRSVGVPDGFELDWRNNEFITDRIVGPRSDSDKQERVWYRFKVPLDQFQAKVGGIQDFRSIRFIRMYLKGFQGQTTLRFARLELARNQWRRYRRTLNTQDSQTGPDLLETNCENTFFDINAVNVEENSSSFPFGYVIPPGIQREQANNTAFPDLLQNEQSLAMEIEDLCEDEARAVYKIVNMDMRLYNRLQMFVHAHAGRNDQFLDDDQLSAIIRLGSDFENNYYEYEVPLKISTDTTLSEMSEEYAREVWKLENEFNIPLDKLKEAKLTRNAEGTSLTNIFVVDDTIVTDTDTIINKIRVLGNPYLGPLKSIMLGVVNRDDVSHDVEIWFNELRLSGLDERGGVAAIARVDMQLADLGNLTGAIEYKGIGYGGIEQRLAQRSREEVIQMDASTSLEMGKFLPKESGVKIPMYLQYSKTIKNPEFDPYDRDVRVSEKLESVAPSERSAVKKQAQEVTEIKSINFTNVRKDRTNTEKTPMPWNIENFSTSYSYTETKKRDPFIEDDKLREHSGALNYNYSRGPSYITPFKKLFKKDKYLKLITDFNFNPLPNSFAFSTNINRQHQVTKYRFTDLDDRFSTFYNKSFVWERNYDLKWDLTKALKFNFTAFNYGVIDELKELRDDGTARPQEELNSYIWENVKDFGRTKEYNHNIGVSYTVPLKKIPILDWIQVRAQYDADYSWTTAALNADSLGNVIQNGQGRQINGDFNFENLYRKSKYLDKIQKKKRRGRNGKNSRGGRNSKRGDSKNSSSVDDGGSGKTSDKNSKSKDANNKQATLEKAAGNKGTEGAEAGGDAGGDTRSKKEKRKARKAKSKKDKKKREREPSTVERVLIRPLLMIRKARLTYSEDFTTVIPGYLPRTSYLGQDNGFTAPGWDFIAGLQPDIAQVDGQNDWLDRANAKGWISTNVFQNQQVLQDESQNISARLTLEPFNDFTIELSAERRKSKNSSVYFRDTTFLDGIANPVHSIPRDVGSYSISYFAMNTLFGTDSEELFATFEANRIIISNRIGGGTHETDDGFAEGYGRAQQDILLPAFIAAYTDQDPNTVELSSNQNYLSDVILKELPRINWQMRYNGLSKLPWFSEYFTSFDLTHGYKSNLTINSYNTDQDFDRTQVFREDMNFNFYSQFEVPNLVIDEQFAPLLAIDFKLKNEMSGSFGFSKSRNLQMNFRDTRLTENRSQEITLGFGYTMKDVVIGFLQRGSGGSTAKKRKKTKGKKGTKDDKSKSSGKKQEEGGNLNIDFQFSITDNATFIQRLDQGEPIPARGSKDITISPSIDYDVNDKLNIRLFFDRNQFIPVTTAQFPRTTTNGGVTVTFQLN